MPVCRSKMHLWSTILKSPSVVLTSDWSPPVGVFWRGPVHFTEHKVRDGIVCGGGRRGRGVWHEGEEAKCKFISRWSNIDLSRLAATCEDPVCVQHPLYQL